MSNTNNGTPKQNIGKQEVEQPLMTTGTTEPGFDWGKDDKKSATKPKIGETLIAESGILGVFDK